MAKAFTPNTTAEIRLAGRKAPTVTVEAERVGDFLIHRIIGEEDRGFAVTPVNSVHNAGTYRNITRAREAIKRLSAVPNANWQGRKPKDVFPNGEVLRAAYAAISDICR